MENIVRFATFLLALATLLLVYEASKQPLICQPVAQNVLKCEPAR